MSMKNSNDTIWNQTSNFPICSTAPNHCATVVPWFILLYLEQVGQPYQLMTKVQVMCLISLGSVLDVDNGLFCSPKHPDTLEPILPSVLIGKTASFQRVKWWGFEANHPPPSSSTEVKNVWSYTSIPLYAFMVHRRLLPWH
jgi:hypothetical protein